MKELLPNNYRWQQKHVKQQGTIIEQILQGRGVCTEDEQASFLNPTKEQMHSPYLLNDMEQAVKRIQEARAKGEHIVIYGDYDVDGITSTSILYMFLKSRGYSVSYYIPHRIEEGYGLNQGALQQIGTYAQLVITVDTGIAAVEEVAYAATIGLDVIITDHHECQEVLPKAYCILNPKRPDTTYPFEALAGVGVTFKLVHALALAEDVEEVIWRYIDIVALGTVADVVPLEGENRVITSLGFKQMTNSVHQGVRALLDVLQTDSTKITSNMIGYQLAPRINAAGRVAHAKVGVMLLTTEDANEAKTIATLLDEENKKRQEMEQNILIEAEQYIEDYVDTHQEKVIIVAGKGWHHGVIGIVASRIMGKYYKPTIVLTEEEGVYSGSARSVEGFSIFDALTSAKAHLVRFGGHEMAAGLSLEASALDAFKQQINAYAEPLLTKELLTPSLEVDLHIDLTDVTLALCQEIETLEPFGVSNRAPVFAITGCVQYAEKIGKDKHLKLALQSGQQVLHAVGFDKAYLADCLSEGEEVVVACEVLKNVWNGKTSVQLRIQDVMSTPETINQSKYYLDLYHYLQKPQPFAKDALLIQPETGDAYKAIRLYTEGNVKKAIEKQQNATKDVTKWVGMCYNDDCSFDNVMDYEWDFKTLGPYTCVNQSLEKHIKQLPKMIPSYVDCKDVYKYFRTNSGSLYLHKVVEHFRSRQMTEYKVLQILDIFSELGLMAYKLEGDSVHYTLGTTSKTQLEKSERYMLLQQYAQSISNYEQLGGKV